MCDSRRGGVKLQFWEGKRGELRMREYLFSLAVCTVFAAVLCFIAPSERLEGHQRFVAGLCIICVSLKPCAELIESISSFDIADHISEESPERYDEQWREYLEGYGEEAARDYIIRSLSEVFGVEAKQVRVKFKDIDGEAAFESVYIGLDRSAVFKDTVKIETYFEKIFGCEVTTYID